MKTFRWCDEYGGGLVIAFTERGARRKLHKMFAGMGRLKELRVWLWKLDRNYDCEYPDIFNIYRIERGK